MESGVGPSKVDVFFDFGDMTVESELRVANHFLLNFFCGKRSEHRMFPMLLDLSKKFCQRWSLPDVAGLHDDLGTAQRVPWLPSMSYIPQRS